MSDQPTDKVSAPKSEAETCPKCGLPATHEMPVTFRGKRQLYCSNAHWWLAAPLQDKEKSGNE